MAIASAGTEPQIIYDNPRDGSIQMVVPLTLYEARRSYTGKRRSAIRHGSLARRINWSGVAEGSESFFRAGFEGLAVKAAVVI
jgi:hypothetical protein